MERRLIARRSDFSRGIYYRAGYMVEEFANWKDIYPSTLNGVVFHDIYHHRPTDRGLWFDEFRAMGTAYITDTERIWEGNLRLPFPNNDVFDTLFRGCVHSKSKIIEQYQYDVDVPDHIRTYLEHRMINVWRHSDTRPYIALWKEGHDYGLTHNPEATRRLKQTNFEELFKNAPHTNLIVEMNTGDVWYEK